MSTTQLNTFKIEKATGTVAKFEVTSIPVDDVDRAKAFYLGLGWRLDIDFEPLPGVRAVQMTPPGSPASIQFGSSASTKENSPLQGMILVVDDIEAARKDLIGRGAEVSDLWHLELGKGPVTGPDPERRSYFTRATFADPDGNTWQLQEVTDRLPGRVELSDSAARAERLLETALRHGAYEAVAPKHDWWDWYGAYMEARESGLNPDESSAAAGRYMEEARGVVVPG